MNLQFLEDSPPQIAHTISSFIQRYNNDDNFSLLSNDGNEATIDQLDMLSGIRQWNVTIQSTTTINIDDAEQSHWIYLILEGTTVVGNARIDADRDNKLISLENTYKNSSLLAALYLGDKHLEDDREPRWLQIFPVRKSFLWLIGTNSDDYFVSLDSAATILTRTELFEEIGSEYEVVTEQLRLAPESSGGTAGIGNQSLSALVPASFVTTLPRTRLSPVIGAATSTQFAAEQHYLNFPLDRQQQTNWCWAAVTTALVEYFDREPVSQCELVNKYYQRSDCCSPSMPCNKLESLEDVLSNENLLENDDIENKFSLDTIKTILQGDVKRMVCIRVFNRIGHFIAISGYDENFVFIQDPSLHSGDSKLVDYEALFNGVLGLWTHSYKCFDYEA